MATDRPRLLQLYGTPKMGVLAALGFGGGLPYILVTTVAGAWATAANWSNDRIGDLAAYCVLPYAFKFLWAPLLDKTNAPIFGALGRRRSWMMLALTIMLVPLSLAAFMGGGDSEFSRNAWFVLILAIACVSATYDIASDAYRADILRKEEMGAGASAFVSAYRLALVVAGAGVMALSVRIGWTAAWLAASALLAVGLIGVRLGREPAGAAPSNESVIIAPLRVFWSEWRGRVVLLAVFVLLFRLPDQVGNAMSVPFLMKRMHFDMEAIGVIRQALGVGFTIIGAILGGWMVARWGIVRCLLIFGVLQAATNGGYLALSMVSDAGHLVAVPNLFGGGSERVAWLSGVLIIENLAGGMVAAGFVAFLMSLCDHRHTAAQFALLSAFMALGGVLGIKLCAGIPDEHGWSWFFAITIALGIPGLALIAFVRPPAPLALCVPCPPR